jgi:hypothetical protein
MLMESFTMTIARKVTVLGFQLTLNKHLSFAQFQEKLKNLCNKDLHGPSSTQVLYLDLRDNLIIGSALTLRGHKKSIETHRDSRGNLVVERTEIRAQATGIEPTIFVIHPKTLRGVYYKNYGAPSLNSLQRIFRKAHDSALKSVIDLLADQELQKKNRNATSRDKTKIRKKYSEQYTGDLQIELLATPADLKGLLDKYARLNRCEISATNALISAPMFSPLSPIIKNSKVILSFDNHSGLANIKQTIASSFMGKDYKSLKLLGRGFNGEELSEYVGDIKESYFSYTYDQFIDELPPRIWNEFTNSKAAERLIAIMNNHSATFGKLL